MGYYRDKGPKYGYWAVGRGPCPRTSSNPRTGNDDGGLQDNGLWKGFGHEELEMLSKVKYLLG